MDPILDTLVFQARRARDQQTGRLQQAQAAACQAQDTLDRLLAYRTECLARSPATAGGACDAASLGRMQGFLARLAEAIGQQEQEMGRRGALCAAERERLMGLQQRLTGLETLQRQREEQRLARERRAEQVTSDEFAARAVAVQRGWA